MKHTVFIWKLAAMPVNPEDLAIKLKQNGVKAVAIKVANGAVKYNVPSQTNDSKLRDYISGLVESDIEVQGWGYHYPEQPGMQGDVIMERMEKLDLTTYHIDLEMEWLKPFGMAKAAKQLLEKLKVGGVKFSLCSFRFPSRQPGFPWDACMNHEAIDLATPQVYWAWAKNPATQLDQCLGEYNRWHKLVAPVGPLHGGAYGSKTGYWEPTIPEIIAFRQACETRKLPEVLWYSLDYVLERNHLDWLTAATGVAAIPPPPPVSKMFEVKVVTSYVNVRAAPDQNSADLGDILKGSTVTVLDTPGEYYDIIPGYIYKNGVIKV